MMVSRYGVDCYYHIRTKGFPTTFNLAWWHCSSTPRDLWTFFRELEKHTNKTNERHRLCLHDFWWRLLVGVFNCLVASYNSGLDSWFCKLSQDSFNNSGNFLFGLVYTGNTSLPMFDIRTRKLKPWPLNKMHGKPHDNKKSRILVRWMKECPFLKSLWWFGKFFLYLRINPEKGRWFQMKPLPLRCIY